MEQLEKLPESTTKIRFPDCDPFNHLNNSKYIDYFLNAREDQLLSYYGFDLQRLAREKALSWVVAQNQVAYLTPATLMETVLIQTRLLAAENKSLLMEALMWNEDKTVLKAVLWSRFVHINLRSGKSENHSEELVSFFAGFEYPLDAAVNFDERVLQLKQAGKVTA